MEYKDTSNRGGLQKEGKKYIISGTIIEFVFLWILLLRVTSCKTSNKFDNSRAYEQQQ